MLSVHDRGSTRSGKTYFPRYLERVLYERRQEFVENFQKSKTIDLNSMMENLTITPKPEYTLKEYGVASKQVIKTPIVIPEVHDTTSVSSNKAHAYSKTNFDHKN